MRTERYQHLGAFTLQGALDAHYLVGVTYSTDVSRQLKVTTQHPSFNNSKQVLIFLSALMSRKGEGMPEHSASGLQNLTPDKTLTSAARRLLFDNLGEQWVTQHPFVVGERVTLDEARTLLPWLKERQKEEGRDQGKP